MRVVLVTGAYAPVRCGIGQYSDTLCKGLLKAGVQVAVVTTRGDVPPQLPEGVVHFELPSFSKYPRQLLTDIRTWNPDVVHVQHPTIVAGAQRTLECVAFWSRWLLGLPVVVTLHEPIMEFHRALFALLAGGQRYIVVKQHIQKDRPRWVRWVQGRKPIHWIRNTSMLPQVRLDAAQRQQIVRQYASDDRALIASMGFLTPANATEWLFEMCDPQRHHLVLIGEIPDVLPEHKQKLERLYEGPWAGHVTTTGFLPPAEASSILAAADAVVLPMRQGGGDWSTSIHAATDQGTFVLATSATRSGYDPARNIYFAKPGDLDQMRTALNEHLGQRVDPPAQTYSWTEITKAHLAVYHEALNLSSKSVPPSTAEIPGPNP